MRLALLLALAVIGVGIGIVIRQKFRGDHVSEAWLVEDDRRQWGAGIDQSCWDWPYRGYKENPQWNAERERKRA